MRYLPYLIVGLLLLGGASYGLYRLLDSFYEDKARLRLSKKEILLLNLFLFLAGAAGSFFQLAIREGINWEPTGVRLFCLILGGYLFTSSFAFFLASFQLHYYKLDAKKNAVAPFGKLLIGSILAFLASFLFLGEAAAPLLSYPLVSSFVINSTGFHWTTYLTQGSYEGGVRIAFYGIIMISGAFVCYLVSDHEMYRRFGVHGLFEGTLIVGFLGGVVGSRIGYVIGNWHGDSAGGVNFSEEVAAGNWQEIFAIWHGGLTILGGAIGGILCGVIWFHFRKKTIGGRVGIDCAVPTILLGQAIGRWGNFFNHEVYGAEVAKSSMSFLPSWLVEQMSNFENTAGTTAYIPLFLIESAINFAGYFLIVYGLGKWLKKWHHDGDNLGFYLIWYGIVRAILEPLRDPTYNMGTNGKWSSLWSYLYIGVGILWLVGLHLFDYLYYKKKGHPRFVPSYRGIPIWTWRDHLDRLPGERN